MQIVDRLAITCNLYSSKHAFKKYRSCSQVTSFMPRRLKLDTRQLQRDGKKVIEM